MMFADVLAAYGREAKTRLNGPGEPAAALTTPPKMPNTGGLLGEDGDA